MGCEIEPTSDAVKPTAVQLDRGLPGYPRCRSHDRSSSRRGKPHIDFWMERRGRHIWPPRVRGAVVAGAYGLTSYSVKKEPRLIGTSG
jgi:hypothetical protein